MYAAARHVCSDCDRGLDCCGCGCRDTSFFRSEKPQFHRGKANFQRFNKSRRFIAVEIEVADTDSRVDDSSRLYKTIKRWGGQIVEDGSLPDTGFEINTAPAAGDLFVKEIAEICKDLSFHGASVTKACGLHVHVDARDFNFYDMRRLVYLYSKVEPALFGMVSGSRRNSRYCEPCGDYLADGLDKFKYPKAAKNKLLKNIYRGNHYKDARKDKYAEGRYAAMNLHSWMYRGTVENRMHHGTVNYTKIINWSMLWASILDFAYANSEKYIKDMNDSSVDILKHVAPASIRDWIDERHNKFSGGTQEEIG